MLDFIKYRKIYYILSGILVISSLFSLIFYRLNFGIDFTGGSILILEFKNGRPTNQEVESKLADLNLGEITIQPTGETDLILRVKYIEEGFTSNCCKNSMVKPRKKF